MPFSSPKLPLDDAVCSAVTALATPYLANPMAGSPPRDLIALAEQHSIDALLPFATQTEPAERLVRLRRCFPALRKTAQRFGIERDFLPESLLIHMPLAEALLTRSQAIRAAHDRAALIGINGAQGSGKSTLTGLLTTLLQQGYGRRVAAMSIDDVYKTYEERQAMARRVHPLFAIRSVAGTHDTALAKATLHRLLHATADDKIAIPRFDKSARGGAGDRLPPAQWPTVSGPLDMVIFEGWCIAAPPQNEQQLREPVNDRERLEDPDGTWRRTMNDLLATEYAELFAMIDELLVLQVRRWADVVVNRQRQEAHLRAQLAAAKQSQPDSPKGVVIERAAMTPEEVHNFTALFERTTRHMLAELPNKARLTLYLGERHRIERICAKH